MPPVVIQPRLGRYGLGELCPVTLNQSRGDGRECQVRWQAVERRPGLLPRRVEPLATLFHRRLTVVVHNRRATRPQDLAPVPMTRRRMSSS